MNTTDAVILFLSFFMLFWGWLGAFIAYRRKTTELKEQHKLELRANQSRFYLDGWNDGAEATLKIAAEAEARHAQHTPRHPNK